jgi:hypothetical protein
LPLRRRPFEKTHGIAAMLVNKPLPDEHESNTHEQFGLRPSIPM